jgi:hypothetical protein
MEETVAEFLSAIDTQDQRRWQGLREAIYRAHEMTAGQGVSFESVRIGIKDLALVKFSPVEEEGSGSDTKDLIEEDDDEVEVSPIRRSLRRSVKAEKARAVERDDGSDDGRTDGEGDVGEAEVEKAVESGDDVMEVEKTGASADGVKGVATATQGLQEKKKKDYLPYKADLHFYWATAVRSF